MDSVFNTLNQINVNGHTEEREGLTYLSWAWAWAEVKKVYPEAQYEVIKNNGLPYFYDEKTGYMVYTRMTIEGLTYEMWLPVMDSKNKAMKAEPYTYIVRYRNGQEVEKVVEAATMFDINKTIMRCLVKNISMFGLGLYIYAGEDLPEGEEKETEKAEQKTEKAEQKTKKAEQKTEKKANPNDEVSYALQKINANHAATIMNKCLEKNIAPSKILEAYALKDISEMNMAQFQNCVKRLGIS